MSILAANSYPLSPGVCFIYDKLYCVSLAVWQFTQLMLPGSCFAGSWINKHICRWFYWNVHTCIISFKFSDLTKILCHEMGHAIGYRAGCEWKPNKHKLQLVNHEVQPKTSIMYHQFNKDQSYLLEDNQLVRRKMKELYDRGSKWAHNKQGRLITVPGCDSIL